MNSTCDVRIGQLVMALKGRDKGTVQVISELVDETHVRVVDGKVRIKAKPKLKNIKHLQVYNKVLEEFEQKLARPDFYDSHIRAMIEDNTPIV